MRVNKMLCFCVFMAITLPFVMTGCSKKTPDSETVQEKNSDSEAIGSPESLDTPEEADSLSENGEDSDNITEGRTSGPMLPIYFDFDSSQIMEEQVERLEHNGDFIKKNNDVKVTIEGNCDQRGTREYNLALGERRALAAKKYLVNLGVDQEQLSTISWGEEKLLLFGEDELSWAQNRRDDFVLSK